MLQDEAQSESLPAKTASAEVISTNSGGGDSETDAPVLLDKPASVPLKARRVLGGTTSEERLKEIRETFELHKAFSRDRHESKVQREQRSQLPEAAESVWLVTKAEQVGTVARPIRSCLQVCLLLQR